MASLTAKFALRVASLARSLGGALDSIGKGMEVTKYTEKLVPSTRFVAVDGVAPVVNEMSFVAPSASVVGDVTIGKESSVWYGAILRGDVNTLTVGNKSSVGDRAVVHVAKIQGDHPTHIGDNVTIGAGALVHAATINDAVMIGESAQVLDGSVVESNSIISAGSIVSPGTKIKSGELWGGTPAKKVRALTEEEISSITETALETVLLASKHAIETTKPFEQVLEEEELAEIKEVMSEDYGFPGEQPYDNQSVQGQGQPGRIFRSTLSHPFEGKQEQVKQTGDGTTYNSMHHDNPEFSKVPEYKVEPSTPTKE